MHRYRALLRTELHSAEELVNGDSVEIDGRSWVVVEVLEEASDEKLGLVICAAESDNSDVSPEPAIEGGRLAGQPRA